MAGWIGLSNHPHTHTHKSTNTRTDTAAKHLRQTERKTQIRFYIFNCQSSSQFPSLFAPRSLCRCWNYNQSLLAALSSPLSTSPFPFCFFSYWPRLTLSILFYFCTNKPSFSFYFFLDFPHENSKVKIPLAATKNAS